MTVNYCNPTCMGGQQYLVPFLYGGLDAAPVGQWSVYSGGYPATSIRFNDDECSDPAGVVSGCTPSGTGAAVPPPASEGFWVDWDGDGRADFAANSGGNIGVYRSTGTGWTSLIATGIPYASNYRVLDIDGDGLDDLARVDGTTLRIYTHRALQARQPNT